ncbi:MAG: OmpA family protein [Pseudomonadota bacterium]
MTRSIALVVLSAVLWAMGGTWYYDCKIKRVCGPETAEPEVAAAVAAAPAEADAVIAPAAAAATTTTTSRETAPAPQAAVSLTVYFGRKSTDIVVPAASAAALPELLAATREGRKLRVVGHSDARGKPALKAELSAQRALILRDWLLAQGIPATAIAAVESQEDREPVADNATAAGRAQNRRAVATLVTKE